jgi:hypothetical protein
MPDLPPACIGEEAIAIEYHFDRGRASRRVALQRAREGREPAASRCCPTCTVSLLVRSRLGPGRDRAWAQHVDPYMALLEIKRPVTREAADGGLGCAVGAEGGIATMLAVEPVMTTEAPSTSSGSAFCTVNRTSTCSTSWTTRILPARSTIAATRPANLDAPTRGLATTSKSVALDPNYPQVRAPWRSLCHRGQVRSRQRAIVHDREALQ